jgi:hypothetical protein
MLIYWFLNVINFHISMDEFKSYYSDSIDGEFSAPKIIKCRLILPDGSEHKLETAANAYLCSKTVTHLYEDLIISDLLAACQQ